LSRAAIRTPGSASSEDEVASDIVVELMGCAWRLGSDGNEVQVATHRWETRLRVMSHFLGKSVEVNRAKGTYGFKPKKQR